MWFRFPLHYLPLPAKLFDPLFHEQSLINMNDALAKLAALARNGRYNDSIVDSLSSGGALGTLGDIFDVRIVGCQMRTRGAHEL